MTNYTEEKLKENYTIRNAKIIKADLSLEDHGFFCPRIVIEGEGWGCVYGGFNIGHKEGDSFIGWEKGIEVIMRIMDTVGVDNFSDLNGKYIRVCTKGWGGGIKIIGNIIKDKWFCVKDLAQDNIDGGEKS